MKENERTELEQLIKSGVHSARVIARARTLLLLDRSQGQARRIQDVIEAAMVSQGTIYTLKKRYFAEGIQGALYERPRPGRKPKVDGEVEAHLIVLVCSEPPDGYERFPPAEARRIAAKIEWHDTPEHASWLNIAECELPHADSILAPVLGGSPGRPRPLTDLVKLVKTGADQVVVAQVALAGSRPGHGRY